MSRREAGIAPILERMRALPLWERSLAVITGVLVGVGVGLPLSGGDPAAAFVGALLAVGLFVVLSRIPSPGDRRVLLIVTGVGFAVRLAGASVVYVAATALGRGGYVTGDDLAYSQLAWGFVEWIRGTPSYPYVPPTWMGNAYLFGTFVYLESAIYWIVGPDVLIAEFVNVALAALTILLVFALARRLFGRSAAVAAAVVFALDPSLILWSVLNLKDALVLLLSTAILLLVVRSAERPRWIAFVAIYVALFLIQSMRIYIFVGLALVIPVSVLVGRMPRWTRARWTIATAAVSAVLLVLSGTSSSVVDPLNTLVGLQGTRTAMAANARTGFVEPPPVQVAPNNGETFVVQAPPSVAGFVRDQGVPGAGEATPALNATAPPSSPSPRVVYVGPETRVVLLTPTPVAAASSAPATPKATSTTSVPPSATPRTSATPGATPTATSRTTAAPGATPTAPPVAIVTTPPSPPTSGEVSAPPAVVYVQPGDIVVVGVPGTSPAPPDKQQKLALTDQRGVPSTRFAPTTSQTPENLVLTRTVTYLPTGISHALLAPFPWDVRRAADLLTVPDMLVLYVLFACAAVSVWRYRTRVRGLAPLILYVGGNLLLFSLAEGNVGTLYRHRAMIIPATIVLASPALYDLAMVCGRAIARRRSPSLGEHGAPEKVVRVI